MDNHDEIFLAWYHREVWDDGAQLTCGLCCSGRSATRDAPIIQTGVGPGGRFRMPQNV
jgi:hypothetical protein